MEKIKAILPQIILLEVRSETEVMVRLIGTKGKEFTGKELTGENIISLFAEHECQMVGFVLNSMTQHPCGCRSVIASTLASGLTYQNEFSIFPVAPEKASAPSQLLGCFQRFTLEEIDPALKTGIEVNSITELELLDIGAGLPGS